MTSITGIHPYADKFPMLPQAEHEELRESIRANGLRNPIVLDTEARIIDGRNRNKACEELRVDPDVVVYEGNDIAEYVIDCNVTRRNMSAGARAMATALIYIEDGRRGDGRWKRDSIDIGTGSDSEGQRKLLNWAGTVLDYKPDLADAVVAEQVSLKEAYEQAKSIKHSAERDKIMERERKKREKQEAAVEAERNAKIVADLEQAGSKFTAMIESGDMTPAAAWAAHNADDLKEKERRRAERRNDEEQAQMICQLLDRMLFLEYPNQREWCIRAFAKYPEAVQFHNPENHTPARIHELADYLHTYANELQSANVA